MDNKNFNLGVKKIWVVSFRFVIISYLSFIGIIFTFALSNSKMASVNNPFPSHWSDNAIVSRRRKYNSYTRYMSEWVHHDLTPISWFMEIVEWNREYFRNWLWFDSILGPRCIGVGHVNKRSRILAFRFWMLSKKIINLKSLAHFRISARTRPHSLHLVLPLPILSITLLVSSPWTKQPAIMHWIRLM